MYQVMYKGLLVTCQSREALDSLTAQDVVKVSNPPQQQRRKKRKKIGKPSQWDRARTVAMKLGREDIGKIRTEIKEGKHKHLLS